MAPVRPGGRRGLPLRLSAWLLVVGLLVTACGAASPSRGVLAGWAPGCPGPSGTLREKVDLTVEGPGVHRTVVLSPPYHFAFSVPPGRYLVVDRQGVTEMTVEVRAHATTYASLGSSCS